jgi:ubiquitin-protein ligase
MDILKDAWSPAFTAEMVLIAALSILNDSDERILEDVKNELQELRTKKGARNKRLLRQKLKEQKVKSGHIVECQQVT